MTRSVADTSSPMDWTLEQVLQWLEQLGFAEYKDTFRDNDIQGHNLLELSKVTFFKKKIKKKDRERERRGGRERERE